MRFSYRAEKEHYLIWPDNRVKSLDKIKLLAEKVVLPDET